MTTIPFVCSVIRAAPGRKMTSSMQQFSERVEVPVWDLVVSWLILFPLLSFVSNGVFWFQASTLNNALTQQFGALARADNSSADNTANTLLVLLVLIAILFSKFKAVLNLLGRYKVFVAIVVWPMLSCVWSQLPIVSLEWSILAAFELLFAFYLFQRFSSKQIMQLMLTFGWICLAISICVAVLLPQYGIDHSEAEGAWRGMYFHKNLCSMATVFLLLVSFYAPTPTLLSKLLRTAYVCTSIFVVIMTRSATGKAALLFSLAFVIFTKLAALFRFKDRAAVLAFGSVIGVAAISAGVIYERDITLALGKDPTLTGRTEIWEAIMPSITKHPLLGYGYRAFWRGYQGESANASLAAHWAITSAHNAYLEVWLTLGAIGVFLILITLVKAVRDTYICLSRADRPHLGWYASIIFLTIVFSVDEGGMVLPSSLPWILYIIACIGLSEEAKSIRSGTVYAS